MQYSLPFTKRFSDQYSDVTNLKALLPLFLSCLIVRNWLADWTTGSVKYGFIPNTKCKELSRFRFRERADGLTLYRTFWLGDAMECDILL